MKKRIAIASAFQILLLLGVIGVMAAEHGLSAQYTAMPGLTVGGRYQLTGSVGRQTARPAVETTA